MQPRNSYQSAASLSWTRVEMLLYIYDHAIQAISSGISALEQSPDAAIQESRFKAQKAIVLLADGLDLEQGEIPQNIMQLCAFAIERISTANPEDWRAARRVLEDLRNSFEQIRDEANQLEHSNRIPTLAG